MRGDQGVAWLGKELREPSAFKMLSDGSLGGDVQTMLTLLKNFTGKHHEEVVRRQELLGEDAETARKFSQHHDGRHAGQSGENWLSNAATPQGCVGLVQAMKQLQYIAPVAWGYMPGRPVALSDTQVFHMLDAVKGTWPLPSQKNAREYTSMDVGRLYWTLGVVLHRFQNLPLGPTAFASMLRKQGANTQTMWEKLGLADHRHFATLVERLSRLYKPIMPPPSWAPSGTKMLWPFVFVHVCEYSETLKDPKVGKDGIRCVLAGKLTKAEEVAVKDITLALVKHGWPPGTKGRCHMSIVVETVLKMRSAPVLEVAPRQRA